jgi:CRISPR-associated protein Cst2
MNITIKGIELVWLSQTDLTNLNSGEGGTNLVDVKKYLKDGVEYPYVSGQAMRFYLRESIRRSIEEDKFMCVPNDKGENCGDHLKCMNCDLFGYMLPKKGEGAGVRVSPVKVSTAMGLLPLEQNSTIDFLTRKKRKEEGEKASGDIVNVELGVNLYKCGISIDVVRVGVVEEVTEAKGDYGVVTEVAFEGGTILIFENYQTIWEIKAGRHCSMQGFDLSSDRFPENRSEQYVSVFVHKNNR